MDVFGATVRWGLKSGKQEEYLAAAGSCEAGVDGVPAWRQPRNRASVGGAGNWDGAGGVSRVKLRGCGGDPPEGFWSSAPKYEDFLYISLSGDKNCYVLNLRIFCTNKNKNVN